MQFLRSIVRIPNDLVGANAFGNETILRDLNGDGRLDLVVGWLTPDGTLRSIPVSAYLGDGTGRFMEGTTAVFGTAGPLAIAPRFVFDDFNRDGRTDIFVLDGGQDAPPFGGAPNRLLLGVEGGFRESLGNLPTFTAFTHSATAGDIDRDGDVDIYVGTVFGNTQRLDPYFLINDGTGRFDVDSSRAPAVGTLSTGVYTATLLFDADNDGDLDLYVGTAGDRVPFGSGPYTTSKLLLNDGQGRFAPGAIALPQHAQWEGDVMLDVQPIDLNGDGRLDLIVSFALDKYAGGGGLQILVNQGGGQFLDESAVRLPGQNPNDLGTRYPDRTRLADLNGDGHLDFFLVQGGDTARSAVFINDGLGRFVRTLGDVLPDHIAFNKLTAGDVNGDGRTDLVAYQANFQGEIWFNVYLAAATPAMRQGASAGESFIGEVGSDTLLAGAGNDVVLGGAADDYLRGEEGDDVIAGGDGFDDAHGNMGNDTVTGGLGPDWTVGGKDNDSLSGDDGDDIVYGNLGDDACLGGAGNDVVRGGQQNDVLNGGAGNDFLSGDRDSDTITGGAGADIFHTHGEAGIDRVLDFNRAEGDQVNLLPGTQYTVTQVGSDVVISMTGGGQMTLVGVQMTSLTGGWIFGA